MPSAKRGPRAAKGRISREQHTTISVDAFRRILRALRLAARKTELTTGLSAAQLFVLTTVNTTPGCSVNDIAEATMTDRSSVAAIVDRLTQQGYLSRDRSGEDRRRASITMTPRGRRATGKAAPAPAALLLAGLRELQPTELAGLSRGLLALTNAMGIANEPAGMLFEDAQPARAARRTQTV